MVSGSRINLVVTLYISNPNSGPLESMWWSRDRKRQRLFHGSLNTDAPNWYEMPLLVLNQWDRQQILWLLGEQWNESSSWRPILKPAPTVESQLVIFTPPDVGVSPNSQSMLKCFKKYLLSSRHNLLLLIIHFSLLWKARLNGFRSNCLY